MKLNVKALALAAGIIWGALIFIITFWFLIFGYSGGQLGLLSCIYFGYSVTWYGAFIGLVYGFVDGLVCGAVFAWVYNKFVK